MTAYERYLVYLSQHAQELNPNLALADALEIILKECILDQQPMAFEIMKNAGHSTYSDTSFKDTANLIISKYNEENRQKDNV